MRRFPQRMNGKSYFKKRKRRKGETFVKIFLIAVGKSWNRSGSWMEYLKLTDYWNVNWFSVRITLVIPSLFFSCWLHTACVSLYWSPNIFWHIIITNSKHHRCTFFSLQNDIRLNCPTFPFSLSAVMIIPFLSPPRRLHFHYTSGCLFVCLPDRSKVLNRFWWKLVEGWSEAQGRTHRSKSRSIMINKAQVQCCLDLLCFLFSLTPWGI